MSVIVATLFFKKELFSASVECMAAIVAVHDTGRGRYMRRRQGRICLTDTYTVLKLPLLG